MEFFSFVLFVLFVWTLARALLTISKPSKTSCSRLPPGPTKFPVIGNLHKLGTKPHKSLAEFSKAYGSVMSLKLGQITTVVFSSPTMAKQVLQKQDLAFSNRATPDASRSQHHNEFSVVWLPVSPLWCSLRRIYNSHILSSQKLESNQHLRRQKVEALIAEVNQSCKSGVAVDIGRSAFATSLNMLSNTIFSLDLADPSSEMAREIKKVVWASMEEIGKPNVVDYFPVLGKLDPQGIRRRLIVLFGKFSELFDPLINQRLELMKLHGCSGSNDVLDTLLNISEDYKEEIDRIHIKHLLLDIFAAGTDTTSSTVEWAMAELLRNHKTLEKAREELDQTIGRGNIVEESHISRLPYLRAIVRETFRLHPPVPLLLPRQVDTDVDIGEFTVPKDAQVLVNVWAIGRDPDTWANPNTFMPERFLGSDIDVRGQNFELIPFGAGRRICPGLPLAMRMVYMMLGSLVNSFDWKVEDGMAPEDMNMDDQFGLTLQRAQPLLAIPIQI